MLSETATSTMEAGASGISISTHSPSESPGTPGAPVVLVADEVVELSGSVVLVVSSLADVDVEEATSVVVVVVDSVSSPPRARTRGTATATAITTTARMAMAIHNPRRLLPGGLPGPIGPPG